MSWLPDSIDRGAITDSILPHILNGIRDIGLHLRRSHGASAAGTCNAFGDEQLDVDVSAEAILRRALGRCPSVVTASSEEDPVERALHEDAVRREDGEGEGERFTVAFDPLDGSSIVGANWAVGTIVGVWEGGSAVGVVPREGMVMAVLGVYGPRTTAIVAVQGKELKDTAGTDGTGKTEKVKEGGETKGGRKRRWCFEVGFEDAGVVLLRERVRLATAPFATRYFAPANLRAAAEDGWYAELVAGYIRERYTLRYSGGLVPDVAHALAKGHGIYVSPVSRGAPAKLRRLYELCPVALVVECAGGEAVEMGEDGVGAAVLSRRIASCDERGGVMLGNGEEITIHFKSNI